MDNQKHTSIKERNYSFNYLAQPRADKELLEYIEENLANKKINYIVADASNPIAERVVIVHIVNNIGLFGAGFAASIAKKYPRVKAEYLKYVETKELELDNKNRAYKLLGDCLIVQAQEGNRNILIANLFAQNGVRSKYNPTPINYTALDGSLRRLHTLLTSSFEVDPNYPDGRYDYLSHKIQMPLISVGLASGDWSITSKTIKRTIMSLEPQFDVTVCCLSEKDKSIYSKE